MTAKANEKGLRFSPTSHRYPSTGYRPMAAPFV